MATLTGEQLLEEVKNVETRLQKSVGEQVTALKDSFKAEVVEEVKKLIPAAQPTFQAGEEHKRFLMPGFKGYTKPEAEKLANAVMACMGIDRVKRKRASFSVDEMKNMGVTIGADGGYAVPEQFLSEVLRKLVKQSIFMGSNGARVFSGVGLTGSIPKETGTVAFTWENEAVTTTETGKPGLGKIVWQLQKFKGLTDVSLELLRFSAIDMMNLLTTMFGEQQAKVLDAVFMNGSGQGKPLGLRMNTVGANTVGQNGANLTYADLVAIKHKLPVQYRNGASWLMTNEVIELVANLTDSDNRPIFLEIGSTAAGAIGTREVPPQTIGYILGNPVQEQNDIPQNLGGGGNTTEIWFTNLQRAYGIFNDGNMEMSSDESVKFTSDLVVVKGIQFVDGKPTITEASAYGTGIK